MENEQKKQNKERIVTALKELGKTALGFGKAQAILFCVNFVVVTIGMIVVGLGWWSPLVAVAVSFLDLLPVIGSGIVFVPWAIIALIVKIRIWQLWWAQPTSRWSFCAWCLTRSSRAKALACLRGLHCWLPSADWFCLAARA